MRRNTSHSLTLRPDSSTCLCPEYRGDSSKYTCLLALDKQIDSRMSPIVAIAPCCPDIGDCEGIQQRRPSTLSATVCHNLSIFQRDIRRGDQKE
ncbi:hypothetical protein DTO012A9_8247 [Penicillium roqueforti]|nr:hypothetical protein CBS147310_9248 [Penicillium roqueforti]KAI3231007.1 hypothetical protein DTO012A9_8247 [Penicillium roqueforti]